MDRVKTLEEVLGSYDPSAPLERALTIPASWYVDPRVAELESEGVFAATWQMVGRAVQVAGKGDYLTATVAGEPIVVVRGGDGVLRGFFNVCRHHAAAVMTEPCGRASALRCPYHGWTYSLEGELKVTPDFSGVAAFDRSASSLVPVAVAVWENWVFVRIAPSGPTLEEFLGADLAAQVRPLGLSGLHWMERRHYAFECNWKVFVDNYLDGGYHIPYLHKGLDSVLDYGRYAIENGERHCLQHSPVVKQGAEPETGAVRGGDRALYYWIYPNFMINWYEGVMDTNLVLPLGVDRTEVIFDFYFPDVESGPSRARNIASINVGQRIQDEDTAICKQVQRGLASRAYQAGRLSVRREAGEHLFHRLLHSGLTAALRARS
ncbi:MAG TPA: aromatic ring-hydroxylating dioxygenase subunit alpha [Candidatus Polarisedimenticolia bacterium]|nr:aromatic ring-hydroxylating dioxygenase subunit alpha [Candidatus Polarisedimenticolia bacterium]